MHILYVCGGNCGTFQGYLFMLPSIIHFYLEETLTPNNEKSMLGYRLLVRVGVCNLKLPINNDKILQLSQQSS